MKRNVVHIRYGVEEWDSGNVCVKCLLNSILCVLLQIADEMEKERKIFQLQMCEVRPFTSAL